MSESVDDLPVVHTMTQAITKSGNNTGAALAVIDELRKRLEVREADLRSRLAAAEGDRRTLHGLG